MLVTRFRQEALAAAAIRHQNIIAVTDFGVVRGVMPFLVMEFVKGQSLQDILADEGILSPERALEIMSAVCAGVGAAHRQNIVHRDLKPLNIMLQSGVPVSEGLKVLDFGLAKIKSGELLGSFVQAKTSGLMGSPFYMAPEQWSDEEPDVRADIYSLGVILYQMLAGEVPFRGSNIPSIMKKHLTSEMPSFGAFEVEVPPPVEAVVRHALAKEAAGRPASVAEFITELREAVETSKSFSYGVQSVSYVQGETVVTGPVTSGSLSGLDQRDTTLYVHSFPPSSRVFINNISVGITDQRGELVLHDMLRGEHQVVVAHEGFQDWRTSIDLDGGNCRVEAKLESINTGASEAGGVSGTIEASSLYDVSISPAEREAPELPLNAGRQGEAETSHLDRSGQQAVLPTNDDRRANPAGVEEASRPQEEVARSDRHNAPFVAEADLDSESATALLSGASLREALTDSGTGTQASQSRPDIINTAVSRDARQSVAGENAFATVPLHHSTAKNAIVETSTAGMQIPPQTVDTGHAQVRRSPLPFYIIVSLIGFVIILIGGTLFVVKLTRGHVESPKTEAVKPASVKPSVRTKPDLLAIPGGKFMMGRDNGGNPESPAHAVEVQPFSMDRTEVTNTEYAEFIADTGQQAPPGWSGNQPPSGQENWPVSNVSFDDAKAFAEWRSKRDGVAYRLPTEQEWEFAARNGGEFLYPWGNSFQQGDANLGTRVGKPVGSYPNGRNQWGVDDLIGNLWEWTATPIELYTGNKQILPPEVHGWIVIRGGSFSSDTTGPKAVTAVYREWVEPARKDPKLGFRLVRSGP
jgi:serine/threonine-protein kinase